MPSIRTALTELASKVTFAFNPQRSEYYQLALEGKTEVERIRIMEEAHDIERERILLTSEIARSPFKGYDPSLSIRASKLMTRAAACVPGMELANSWSRVRQAVMGSSATRWGRLSRDIIAMRKCGVDIYGSSENFQDTLAWYWRLLNYGLELDEMMKWHTAEQAMQRLYRNHAELENYDKEFVYSTMNKALNIVRHVRCYIQTLQPSADVSEKYGVEPLQWFLKNPDIWTCFVLYYEVRVAETGSDQESYTFVIPKIDESYRSTSISACAWLLEKMSGHDLAMKYYATEPKTGKKYHTGLRFNTTQPTY